MLKSQQKQMLLLSVLMNLSLDLKILPPLRLRYNKLGHIARYRQQPWPFDASSRSPTVNVGEISAEEPLN